MVGKTELPNGASGIMKDRDMHPPRKSVMTTLSAIRTQALQLSPPEREELAQQLLESLPITSHDSTISVDPEFEQEVHRRINSLDDGTAKFTSGDQFLAELQALRQRALP